MNDQGPLAMFRFDAGLAMGGGHAMRCLTLAEAMMAAGWECRFAIGPGTMEAVHRLAPHEARCLHLDVEAVDEPDRIADHLGGAVCDLFVVDHYGRGQAFERAVRRLARRILVIDDLARGEHDADLLLDQNLGRKPGDYRDLTPADCRLLLGPSYALLRPQFRALRGPSLTERRRRKTIERVLITYGLSDSRGLIVETLRALREVSFAGHVDVVIGAGVPGMGKIHAAAAEMGDQVRVLCDVEDMATLMAAADLAIGAGGSTSWERCALGLPALLTVIADNQRRIAEELERAGAVRLFENDGNSMAAAFTALAADNGRLHEMSAAAARICDGLGCERVMEALRR